MDGWRATHSLSRISVSERESIWTLKMKFERAQKMNLRTAEHPEFLNLKKKVSCNKMKLTIDKSIEILERTPDVLSSLLLGLSEEWAAAREGENTWSAYDVVGHLIHGEKTDWMVRINLILSKNENKTFESFDRFAQFENSKGKSLGELLAEFKALRGKNMAQLKSLNIEHTQLSQTAIHPSFGEVTLNQLLATWVVHDLDHLAQISRVMAKQYKYEVGPWIEYLKILRQS